MLCATPKTNSTSGAALLFCNFKYERGNVRDILENSSNPMWVTTRLPGGPSRTSPLQGRTSPTVPQRLQSFRRQFHYDRTLLTELKRARNQIPFQIQLRRRATGLNSRPHHVGPCAKCQDEQENATRNQPPTFFPRFQSIKPRSIASAAVGLAPRPPCTEGLHKDTTRTKARGPSQRS